MFKLLIAICMHLCGLHCAHEMIFFGFSEIVSLTVFLEIY